MEEFFNELRNHLLQDEIPSYYFNRILNSEEFKAYPFNLLYELKHTKQSAKYHPEGSAWNHTTMVTDQAAKVKEKSNNTEAFMWGALLHDIGKPSTTKVNKGRVTSYDHDKVGANLAKDFLKEFINDTNLINNVSALVRWHMQILFVVNNMPFANIKDMTCETDINEIALLGLCDRLGRTGADRLIEEKNISIFLEKCKAFK